MVGRVVPVCGGCSGGGTVCVCVEMCVSVSSCMLVACYSNVF